MTLLDLLARELESWPCEGDELITQSAVDSEIYFGANGNVDYSFKPCINLSCRHSEQDNYPEVSMAQWQSARDKLKGETKVTKPKANKDGWVRHRGGKCPVADRSTYINGRFRSGEQYHGPAYGVSWLHVGNPGDLMAYRIHAPEQADPKPDLRFLVDNTETAEPVQVEYADSQMPAAKYFDGPLQWRDRIHTIDFDKAAAQQAHDAAMAALDSERAELVAKLKAEGLALISEPIKAEDSAQGEDMSDPAKWRAGDMVISLEEEEDISKGGVYQITEIYGSDVLLRDNAGDRRNRCASDYKWHSRP